MPILQHNRDRIYWEPVGSGPPLLLIQGIGYPSDANWRIVPALAARCTVIQFDNPGVGRSDVPNDELTIGQMADAAGAVIEAAGLGAAHVAGFSMGGLIAQELALNHPLLVRTLTIGCSSPGGDAAVPASREVGELLRELALLPAREAAERSASIVYAAATPRTAIKADIDVRMARPTSRHGYFAQLLAVGDYKGSMDRIDQLTCPVLIVQGDEDRLVPPVNADVLRKAIPQARRELLVGAGHILMTDATEQLTRLILDFVAEYEAATSR